jgi:hypothetical protein
MPRGPVRVNRPPQAEGCLRTGDRKNGARGERRLGRHGLGKNRRLGGLRGVRWIPVRCRLPATRPATPRALHGHGRRRNLARHVLKLRVPRPEPRGARAVCAAHGPRRTTSVASATGLLVAMTVLRSVIRPDALRCTDADLGSGRCFGLG